MAEIEVISTCSVKMANNGGMSRIEYTPYDWQFLLVGPIQKGLLFYKPHESENRTPDNKSFIDHLKTSLSRALDFFPLLSGRLAATKGANDNTSCFFINCNDAGVEFTHAIAHGVYIRDILDSTRTPAIVRSFFSLNGVLNIEGVSKPLLAVQVTELVDGFFVACSMNHSIMDGTSFWHFFNSWSEISRGLDKVQKPPILDRSFLLNFSKNRHITLPHFDRKIHDESSAPPVHERVFHFGKENVSKLKARANTEAGTDNQISSFQTLIAHLWRAVMRCRAADPDIEVSCIMFIGTRTRIPLPDTYCGNAIHASFVSVNNGNLLRKGLGWVALELNKSVALQTKEEAKRVLEEMLKNPVILKKSGVMAKNTFFIGSSTRHNVYYTDFGWGKPVAVRSGGAQKYDGKMTVFPAAETGGIDVEVCLTPETLLAVENDAEFMEAVTL